MNPRSELKPMTLFDRDFLVMVTIHKVKYQCPEKNRSWVSSIYKFAFSSAIRRKYDRNEIGYQC